MVTPKPPAHRLLAFLYGAPIGALGGLIGLGGAEFRLPVLKAVFNYSTPAGRRFEPRGEPHMCFMSNRQAAKRTVVVTTWKRFYRHVLA